MGYKFIVTVSSESAFFIIMTRWNASFGVGRFRVKERHTSVRFNSVFIYFH